MTKGKAVLLLSAVACERLPIGPSYLLAAALNESSHPERSRGICGSADLSWKCFSG